MADLDVVHVQGVHNAVPPLALATAEHRRIPSLITFHTGGNSSPFRNAIRGVQWRVEGPILRRATRLIAVCEFEADLFADALELIGARSPSSETGRSDYLVATVPRSSSATR